MAARQALLWHRCVQAGVSMVAGPFTLCSQHTLRLLLRRGVLAAAAAAAHCRGQPSGCSHPAAHQWGMSVCSFVACLLQARRLSSRWSPAAPPGSGALLGLKQQAMRCSGVQAGGSALLGLKQQAVRCWGNAAGSVLLGLEQQAMRCLVNVAGSAAPACGCLRLLQRCGIACPPLLPAPASTLCSHCRRWWRRTA